VELAKTLQATHVIANAELIEANNALLRIAGGVETILLGRVVHQHALPRLVRGGRRAKRGHEIRGRRV